MRLSDAETKLKEAASSLDTKLIMSKLREYERYGLPGSSMSDGRGGEPPLPLIGTTDRQIALAKEGILHHVVQAALHAERARRIQSVWCEPLDTEDQKEEKLASAVKGAGPCGNIWCSHTCTGKDNDRLRKANRQPGDDPAKDTVARCRNCDVFWRRHRKERDPRVTSDQQAVCG